MNRRSFIGAALGAIASIKFLRADVPEFAHGGPVPKQGIWETGIPAPTQVICNGIVLIRDQDYFVKGSTIIFKDAPLSRDVLMGFGNGTMAGDYVLQSRVWPDLNP